MNDALRELYRELILEHSRQPRHFRPIAGARYADGHNPLCGDALTVYVVVADGMLQDVAFQGVGCAVALAAASMMTEAVHRKSLTAADACCKSFQALLTTGTCAADLGPLAVFAGVRAFPARVKCATLPWQALRAALDTNLEAPPIE